MLNRDFFRQLNNTPDAARFLLAFIIYLLIIGGCFLVLVQQNKIAEAKTTIIVELCLTAKDIIQDIDKTAFTHNYQSDALNQHVKEFDTQWLLLQKLPHLPQQDVKTIDGLWMVIVSNSALIRGHQRREAEPLKIAAASSTVSTNSTALLTALKQLLTHVRAETNSSTVILIAALSWLAVLISLIGFLKVINRTQPINNTSSVERY